MKTLQKFSVVVGAIIFAAQAHAVMYLARPYEPNLGCWLTRDPFGEGPGFVQRDSLPQFGFIPLQRNEPNLYGFVRNDPVNNVDPLGLLTFEGCEGKEEQLKKAFEDFCKKVRDPQLKCCLGHFNITERLKWRCDHPDDNLHGITIKCEKQDTRLCSGSCGWSLPGGDTVHVCPEQWRNPNCGDVGCTLLHELTHTIGHPFEKWPRKVEKCLGCN